MYLIGNEAIGKFPRGYTHRSRCPIEKDVVQAEKGPSDHPIEPISTSVANRDADTFLPLQPSIVTQQFSDQLREPPVLDTTTLGLLLQADIDRCSQASYASTLAEPRWSMEQADHLSTRSKSEALSLYIRSSSALQAAAIMKNLGYHVSNKQLREYLYSYCCLEGKKFLAEQRHDLARTYFREALRLVPNRETLDKTPAAKHLTRLPEDISLFKSNPSNSLQSIRGDCCHYSQQRSQNDRRTSQRTHPIGNGELHSCGELT